MSKQTFMYTIYDVDTDGKRFQWPYHDQLEITAAGVREALTEVTSVAELIGMECQASSTLLVEIRDEHGRQAAKSYIAINTPKHSRMRPPAYVRWLQKECARLNDLLVETQAIAERHMDEVARLGEEVAVQKGRAARGNAHMRNQNITRALEKIQAHVTKAANTSSTVIASSNKEGHE